MNGTPNQVTENFCDHMWPWNPKKWPGKTKNGHFPKRGTVVPGYQENEAQRDMEERQGGGGPFGAGSVSPNTEKSGTVIPKKDREGKSMK